MSRQSRFLSLCERGGESFTLRKYTGSVCPCMNYRGAGYSAQWHRENPSAADCNGRGIINTTLSIINLKGFFYPASLTGTTGFSEDIKAEIAKLDSGAIILFGQIDTDNNIFYDLSLDEKEYTLVYSGTPYKIYKVFDLADTGQQSILVKTTNASSTVGIT